MTPNRRRCSSPGSNRAEQGAACQRGGDGAGPAAGLRVGPLGHRVHRGLGQGQRRGDRQRDIGDRPWGVPFRQREPRTVGQRDGWPPPRVFHHIESGTELFGGDDAVTGVGGGIDGPVGGDRCALLLDPHLLVALEPVTGENDTVSGSFAAPRCPKRWCRGRRSHARPRPRRTGQSVANREQRSSARRSTSLMLRIHESPSWATVSAASERMTLHHSGYAHILANARSVVRQSHAMDRS